MRLKQLSLYLGLVVLLCCTLSSRAEDDVADVEDEDEVESDSESEQEDKASGLHIRFELLKEIENLV